MYFVTRILLRSATNKLVMYLCYTDLFYSCVSVKGAKFDAIAFSIYFKSYPDVGYTRNARCPFWLPSEGGIAARRSIFRVSIRDSRGVDGSICDRSWRGKSPPREGCRREAHSEYVIDASIQPKPRSYDGSKTSGMHNVRNECEMDRFTRSHACECSPMRSSVLKRS